MTGATVKVQEFTAAGDMATSITFETAEAAHAYAALVARFPGTEGRIVVKEGRHTLATWTPEGDGVALESEDWRAYDAANMPRPRWD